MELDCEPGSFSPIGEKLGCLLSDKYCVNITFIVSHAVRKPELLFIGSEHFILQIANEYQLI